MSKREHAKDLDEELERFKKKPLKQRSEYLAKKQEEVLSNLNSTIDEMKKEMNKLNGSIKRITKKLEK